MTYIATTMVYNDFREKEETVHYFIVGETYTDVVSKLEKYFGQDLESIYIEPFSPDDFIEFNEDMSDLFKEVKIKVGENVIW